jgi:hypothetical protein
MKYYYCKLSSIILIYNEVTDQEKVIAHDDIHYLDPILRDWYDPASKRVSAAKDDPDYIEITKEQAFIDLI